MRGVATLATGTAAAQLITTAASPLITRLYGPEAFGILGTFTSIGAVLVPAAALAYPIAIVLPKRNDEALQLAGVSFVISTVLSGLVAVILLLLGPSVASLLGVGQIQRVLYLIPIFILFSAYLQIARQWQVRNQNFRHLAFANLLQAALVSGLHILFGLTNPAATLLIVVVTLGKVLHAGLLAWPLALGTVTRLRRLASPGAFKIQIESYRRLLSRYRDFPLYRAPEQFLNSVSQSLPVILLLKFFGPTAAGYYSLCRLVLGAPSHLVGDSVGAVFYPRISKAVHTGENLTVLIKRATAALALVGSVPYGLVVMFGPVLFAFIFGDDWSTAGEFARWIALWLYAGLMNRPAVHAIPVLQAQRFHLYFSIVTIMLRLSVLALGYYAFNSSYISIALFGVIGMLINGVLVAIVHSMARRFDANNADQLSRAKSGQSSAEGNTSDTRESP